MIKIGAVWAKDKDGKEYLSGKIDLDAPVLLTEGLNILLFKPRETRENGPSWEVFVSKPKTQAGTTGNAATAKRHDDDIPFD